MCAACRFRDEMRTPPSPHRTRRFAVLFAGTWLALSCAGTEAARQGGPETTVSPAFAATATQASSGSSCGGPEDPGAAARFQWPVNGRVTSRFGQRGRRPHRGIDISARRGSAVRAAAAGTVVFSDRKRNYGRVVILAHPGGYETLYAHNQENLVWDGTHVKQGQTIAEIGSTGNAAGAHLHFEVRHARRALDPLACLPLRTTRRP